MEQPLYDLNRYKIIKLDSDCHSQRYHEILAEAYTALGFYRQEVLPGPDTQCFGLFFDGEMEATFGLTARPYPEGSLFRSRIPSLQGDSSANLLEASNVVLSPRVRGGLALGIMLHYIASYAVDRGYDYVVGITRYQTLRFFVEFGLVPVDHDPLHVLGREDIDDWVMYYETRGEAARFYLQERARRFFHQQQVMARIRSRRQASVSVPVNLHEEPAYEPA